MGYYINPPDQTKEEFLQQWGTQVTPDQVQAMDWTGGNLPVCWVDNGLFTAAGIGYCQGEAEYFLRSFASGKDQRPHQWFLVPKTALEPYFKT